MILQGVSGENRELRVIERGAWDGPRVDRLIEAQGISVNASIAGVSPRSLMIATVACAHRLVSETIACFPLRTYTGDALDKQPVYAHAAAKLFQDPTPGHGSAGLDSFEFWSDVAGGVESDQAAVVWKVKGSSGQVAELWPLDAGHFAVQSDGRVRKILGMHNGKPVDVTQDVVFVRSWAPRAATKGVSTLQLHDRSFRWAGRYEEYRGRYFEADSSVAQVIEKGPTDSQGREEMARGWAQMVGGKNKGGVGILWGDATLKNFGHSLRDAQASELAIAIAQDVARAFRIYPPGPLYAMLQAARSETVELTSTLFHRFTLLHRERRIERAFAKDRDLFPDPAVYPRFDSSEFIRGDLATIATVAHELNQDGTINRDEARALALGLPPIPGGAGQIFLEHPVGAGPGLIGPGAPPQEKTLSLLKLQQRIDQIEAQLAFVGDE